MTVNPPVAANRRPLQAPSAAGASAGRMQPSAPRVQPTGAGRAGRGQNASASLRSGETPDQVPNEDDAEHEAELSLQAASTAEESGRELLARMRELAALQQQLEGLQQATASLQAAVTQPDETHRSRSGLSGILRRLAQPAADEDAEDEEDDEDDEAVVHPHVTCDGCGSGPPLVGQVFKCLDCEDFDLCAECYRDEERAGHSPDHRFQRRATAGGGRSVARDLEASPQLLLRILESTMLSEALRRSVEGEASEEQLAQAAEARAAEVMSNIPRVCWDPSLQDSDCHGGECALCLEEYQKGEEVLKLQCSHLFHEECVGPWFAKSLLCPLCQKEVS